MENRHAERLTRDVLLTLSSGSNLFYDPFLEFPFVWLWRWSTLVRYYHFVTIISFFFLPIYFYYNYFVICYFTSRAIYRIRRKIRSFLEIAKSRSRMTRAMKRQTFLSFFFFLLTWKLQPAFTANFVDSFLLFLLAHFNLSIFHENDRCALLPVWSTLSVYLIATI